ncbi:NADPH-dependent FMN reductase [Deinococcus altitudinis]|uniref:NADPH-dependent FMN reductase n=1 Tax=Deinococcus altitudinis TaxID=468914 RepID=UPI0038918184
METETLPVRVLALSGSLRGISKNTALLEAARMVAPAGVTVSLVPGLTELPPFNPDHEERPPRPVLDFQRALAQADALLICCPEYAHGVPGAFKNALDWVVGSGELVNKPVGLLNASAGGEYAQDSLRETLSVMSARLVPAACLRVAVPGPVRPAALLAALPEVSGPLQAALQALLQDVRP